MKTEFIECDCHTELICLEFEDDEEIVDNIDNRFLYLSLYNFGNFSISWKQRFRHIWHIIKEGKPWSDQIILRKEERLKLTNFLNLINELEDNK